MYPCVTCVSLPPDSLKVKDVLREFDADGSLARHRHGEVRGGWDSVSSYQVHSKTHINYEAHIIAELYFSQRSEK